MDVMILMKCYDTLMLEMVTILWYHFNVTYVTLEIYKVEIRSYMLDRIKNF